jgi:hypothetical protein
MSIISKVNVLKLNSVWQAVGYSSVGRAIVDLAAGQAAKALDFDYEKYENGEYILDEFGAPPSNPTVINPVDWETWLTLPVRSWEDPVHYANGNKVMRAPTVLVALNFSKMPKKIFKGKPSKEAIWIRDDGIDQYTGKRLKREDATIDHILPQSKGGRDTWENLVTCHKKINSEKGNQLNHEIGLKLIRQPKSPPPIPLTQLIREVRHREWRQFLPHLVDGD